MKGEPVRREDEDRLDEVGYDNVGGVSKADGSDQRVSGAPAQASPAV